MIDAKVFYEVWSSLVEAINLERVDADEVGRTVWFATRPEIEGEVRDVLDDIKQQLPLEEQHYFIGIDSFPVVLLWIEEYDGTRNIQFGAGGVKVTPRWNPNIPRDVLERFDAATQVVLKEVGVQMDGRTIKMHGGLVEIVGSPDSAIAALAEHHRRNVEDQVSKFREQMSVALPALLEGGDEHGPNPSDPD